MNGFNNLDLVILKTITTNKKHGLDFANEFDPTKQQFFSTDVWNFANLVVGYIKTYKELPTLRVLTEKLSKGNNVKLIDNVKKVWESLECINYNDKEFKHDLEKMKKRFAENQISSVHSALTKLTEGSMDVGKAMSEMQKTIQSINAISKNRTYENKSIKDYLPVFVELFNVKKNNPTIDSGLMTKYSFLDFATNGLKPADFVLIAGESGFGKSLFLNNIAVQVWLQDNKIDFDNQNVDISKLSNGKNIIYFSLEMPYEDCFNRLLSRLSGVASRKIENADLTKEEFAKIKKCLDFIKEYPYDFRIIDIADASANDLEIILEDSGEDFDSIFIDYLGIMKTNEKSEEQDWLKQGIISYEIRAIARRYKKPIFSAVQLNRKTTGKDPSEGIGLNRLARSATIATHATHVVQIENREKEEQYPDFIYHIIKNRKGPKGKGNLIKNLSCATLIDNMSTSTEESYDNLFTNVDDISDQMDDLEL
jgi:replicative DNA helicase